MLAKNVWDNSESFSCTLEQGCFSKTLCEVHLGSKGIVEGP